MLAYGALILWEIRRGRVKWYAVFVGLVVAVVLVAILFPVCLSWRNRRESSGGTGRTRTCSRDPLNRDADGGLTVVAPDGGPGWHRLILKTQRLGTRLDRRSLVDPGYRKPMRMHSRTYVQLQRRFDAAYTADLDAWSAELKAAVAARRAESASCFWSG